MITILELDLTFLKTNFSKLFFTSFKIKKFLLEGLIFWKIFDKILLNLEIFKVTNYNFYFFIWFIITVFMAKSLWVNWKPSECTVLCFLVQRRLHYWDFYFFSPPYLVRHFDIYISYNNIVINDLKNTEMYSFMLFCLNLLKYNFKNWNSLPKNSIKV